MVFLKLHEDLHSLDKWPDKWDFYLMSKNVVLFPAKVETYFSTSLIVIFLKCVRCDMPRCIRYVMPCYIMYGIYRSIRCDIYVLL